MEIACIQWALRRYGHIPWEKTQTRAERLGQRVGRNKPRQFSILRWPMGNMHIELKKNPDFSIVQENVFQKVSNKSHAC